MPLVIPGVETLHERETWNISGYPITGPIQIPTNIWRPVAHYTADDDLPDGDLGEFQYQIGPYLSAVQRDYKVNRNYSIGYLFGVDWLGGVWELRGFDFKAAANSGHNEYTCPLLFLTDLADPGSEEMWASARAIWREFRRRSGRADFENRPWGHGELRVKTGIGTPTACPGAPLLNQRNQGLGDLDYDDVPEPPVPPRPPEIPMTECIYRPYGFNNQFHIVNGYPEVLDPDRAEWYRAQNPGIKVFDGAKDRVNGVKVNRPHAPSVAWLSHVTAVVWSTHPTEKISA